jgi:hypothetical protein
MEVYVERKVLCLKGKYEEPPTMLKQTVIGMFFMVFPQNVLSKILALPEDSFINVYKALCRLDYVLKLGNPLKILFHSCVDGGVVKLLRPKPILKEMTFLIRKETSPVSCLNQVYMKSKIIVDFRYEEAGFMCLVFGSFKVSRKIVDAVNATKRLLALEMLNKYLNYKPLIGGFRLLENEYRFVTFDP